MLYFETQLPKIAYCRLPLAASGFAKNILTAVG
jgi:hypothetical protein